MPSLPPGVDVLPSGRYRVRYRDGAGKQHSRSFDLLADARKWKTTQTSKVTTGTHIDPRAGDVTFREFAESWRKTQGFNPSTADAVELRLRVHVYPVLGTLPLREITPSIVRAWLSGLTLAPTYVRTVLTNVSSVFGAAVDDDLISKNPCSARSVRGPKIETKHVTPWTSAQVLAVHDSLPEQFRIMATLAAGLGLRQGEVFGLSPDDVDFLRGRVRVQRQVKVFGGNRLAFALPKSGRTREVPLPSSVRDELAQHLAARPAVEVTLPFGHVQGPKTTVPLILTNRESKALNRNYVNGSIWKPSVTAAGITPTRETGMHALRHWYASALLDAGESIRAVSDFLGHADPGFTLRVYAHLMPSSDDRTKSAVDAALGSSPSIERTAQ